MFEANVSRLWAGRGCARLPSLRAESLQKGTAFRIKTICPLAYRRCYWFIVFLFRLFSFNYSLYTLSEGQQVVVRTK